MSQEIASQVLNRAMAQSKGFDGSFYGVKETAYRIAGRQKVKIGQAADDHRILFSAFYHSRPRVMGGHEDSSLLNKYMESCITPDEKGNVVAWVEKYSSWKWKKEESENGQVIKKGTFKFSKTGNAWDLEQALRNPYMMQDTKARIVKEMLGLSGVVDKLEEFTMRQRKLLSNPEKYAGGTFTEDLRLLLVDFTEKLEEIKRKEARMSLGIENN
jgi:hypothetical protein